MINSEKEFLYMLKKTLLHTDDADRLRKMVQLMEGSSLTGFVIFNVNENSLPVSVSAFFDKVRYGEENDSLIFLMERDITKGGDIFELNVPACGIIDVVPSEITGDGPGGVQLDVELSDTTITIYFFI